MIIRWWKRRQRRLDLEFVWPVLQRETRTREAAVYAFWLHTCIDPAYSDLTEQERLQIVRDLP